MRLLCAGAADDLPINESLAMICRSTNGISATIRHEGTITKGELNEFILSEVCCTVIFVSHGGPGRLVDGEKRPFLEPADHHLLIGKHVFAHACSSAIGLGRDLTKSAFFFFGFDGPISSPGDASYQCYAAICDLYVRMLSFVGSVCHIENTNLVSYCQDFLDNLRERAVDFESSFDTPQGSLLNAEELIAVSQFGRIAAVWVHQHPEMLKATGAPTRPSLW